MSQNLRLRWLELGLVPSQLSLFVDCSTFSANATASPTSDGVNRKTSVNEGAGSLYNSYGVLDDCIENPGHHLYIRPQDLEGYSFPIKEYYSRHSLKSFLSFVLCCICYPTVYPR